MVKPITLHPRVRELLKKGLKHHRAGRRREAETCYRRSLKADPLCPQALHLMGLLAQQAGQYPESIRLIGQALDLNPDDPDTLNSLAESYIFECQFESARQCYQRLAEVLPRAAEAHHRLGKVQERTGDWEAATTSYRRALSLQPDSPDLHGSLARLQYKQGAFAEAVESCRRALELDPIRHEFHAQLGNALTDLGNYGPAVEALRCALALKPDSAYAVFGLGYFFERKGDFNSAADSYQKALALDPRLEGAHLHLGIISIMQGDMGKAAECFNRVLELTPDSAEARSFLGLIHLTQGNFSLGWEEYEARRGTPQYLRDRRTFRQPMWKGGPLEGARILLYAEQGLGDTLQFARYIPLVAASGGKVILEVPSRLHRLLAETPGAAEVIRHGEPLPEFEFQCPLLSLPLALATELSSIPAQIPYLHPDPTLAEAWRKRMPGNSLRIGLVWGGSPLHPHDARRSMPLELLAPLISLPGTTFYSLQMGPPAEQVKQLGTQVHLVDLQDEQKDFADTAAIVASLDLVISVDTSVVHLAGAMGVPVWVLLNSAADWRWMLKREDSPWYPTVRLFRQTTRGNWQDVVTRVERELRMLIEKKAATRAEGDPHE